MSIGYADYSDRRLGSMGLEGCASEYEEDVVDQVD